ncbi:hypothetical protein E4U55_007521 [Claviceps digitariae]|nr:hypothetical protein E4U55_007521 [Claviceps digitariae]
MASPHDKHEALQPIHPSMAGKLDPVFEKLYNEHVAHTPLQPIDLSVLRTKYSLLYSYGTGPAPDVGRIYDARIPLDDGTDTSLPVRVYEPDSPGPWPVHVDFHGGGWGLGDLDTEAHICRHICKKAGVVVIDVAYRLVPEVAFPAGITDSFAAVRYIAGEEGAARFNVRRGSMSLGGVSAGGCIALAVAHLARDHVTTSTSTSTNSSPSPGPNPIPVRLVVVGTPVIDDLSQYACAADSPFPSMQQNEYAPTLNWARLAWFDKLKWSSVVPAAPPASSSSSSASSSADAAALHRETLAEARRKVGWFANLLRAPNLKDLPKTVIYTAGADPLRDEGERYAQMLVENGVEVTLKRFPGVPHPFMHMDGQLWQARQFIDMTAREIRIALHDEWMDQRGVGFVSGSVESVGGRETG